MEADALTFLFILIIILIGYYLKQLWISLIFAIVLIAFILAGRKKTPKAVPKGSGTRVQPIVVKRKYVGPESIYPKKMKIMHTPDTPDDWWEYSTKPLGSMIGKGAKWIKDLFK